MTESNYENLVCEGGGVKGVAIPGALVALHKLDKLKHIKRYAGSSIGALFCSLLAMKINIEKIVYLTLNVDFTKMRTNSWLVTQMWRLIFRYGLAEHERITKLVTKIYKDVGVDPGTTFIQNFERTGKELYVSGTDVNTNMVFFFSHYTHPDMPILQAVTLSMCVPAYYVPFKFEEDFWVDGGLAENYPIYVFNDMKKLRTGNVYAIDKAPICPNTLGIKLLTPTEKNSRRVYYGRQDPDNVRGFAESLVNTMQLQIETGDISESYIKQTIPILNLDVGILDVDISKDKRREMMKKGETAVKKYFGEENNIDEKKHTIINMMLAKTPLMRSNELINVVQED